MGGIRRGPPHVLARHCYASHLPYSGREDMWFSTNVVGSPEEASRLLLCEATAVVMRKCFYLLGITPLPIPPIPRCASTCDVLASASAYLLFFLPNDPRP
ncbi:hypothetical protein Scep_025609 [Stephania cephalantha]|uniref:DALR anticodon binding domain-containing protein n=1 Tax=Stephania cephalantha TaxID=152367 RepID=A0AAP0HSL1_9MAGN